MIIHKWQRQKALLVPICKLSASEQIWCLEQGVGRSSNCQGRQSWTLEDVGTDNGGGTWKTYTGPRPGKGPELSPLQPTPLSPSPNLGLPSMQGILGKFFPEISVFPTTKFIHSFIQQAFIEHLLCARYWSEDTAINKRGKGLPSGELLLQGG